MDKVSCMASAQLSLTDFALKAVHYGEDNYQCGSANHHAAGRDVGD